jgi:erythromycin esterase-like protein
MYRSSRESWNLRDRHMFDTLVRLLAARGGDAKAVVWAHNSHVGNAAATAMGWQGETSANPAARPSAIQQCWSALAPIAGGSLPRAIGMGPWK